MTSIEEAMFKYRERIMTDALGHAESVLKDYIAQIERDGACLNYGHSVLRRISDALKLAQAAPLPASPTPKE